MADPRNAQAYSLISKAGTLGVSYNELRALHLHGTPTVLLKAGIIRVTKRPDGVNAYVARDRPSSAHKPSRNL